MTECFKCGVLGEKAYLYDAISSEGFVKICKDCRFEEDIPIIKKRAGTEQEKAEKQLSESNPVEFRDKIVDKPVRRSVIYERLMKMSGLNKEPVVEKEKKSEELFEEEQHLRKLVEEKVVEVSQVDLSKVADAIENFHWKIMRARRAKKLTQEQLAKDIAEPEELVKLIEAGKIPENSDNLIKKLEAYLGVDILKKKEVAKKEIVGEKSREKAEDEKSVELSFDPVRAKQITIADLQEAKNKKEADILGVKEEDEPEFLSEDVLEEEVKENLFFFSRKKENHSGKEKKPIALPEEDLKKEVEEMKKEGLSEDDINDLIFGR